MLGWYAYAFAAEPFVVSAVATYVPLLLESLARDNAVLASDHRTPCRVPGDTPGLLPTPIAPPKCVLQLGWLWIDTSSLPLYTFAVSVAVQTVLVISISGVADRSLSNRKKMLVFFSVLGSIATIIMAKSKHVHYYVAAAMAVVANASFGAVTVCGNAYIPALVDLELKKKRQEQQAFANYGSLIDESVEREAEAELGKKISAKVSGRGAAIGYASAFFVQIITMGMLFAGGDNSKLNTVITFIGLWWLIGQIPVILFLKIKNEDIDDDDASDNDYHYRSSLLADIVKGWSGLIKTFRQAYKLQDICMFLVGWFLLSDSVTTMNSTAVLFARTNLGMATPALALIGLITVVFAIAGSLVFSKRNSSQSLVFISLLGAAIPFYGIVGFFQPFVGLNHPWELYALASWYGFMLGALNAVTRSMYALLIPKGHEVMFFALYAVTDKGSSILGPTITGLITDYTHNIRYTFYFLLGMMLCASTAFSHVNYTRGQHDASEVTVE